MGCNKEKKSDLCVKQDIFTLLRTGHFHFALTKGGQFAGYD